MSIRLERNQAHELPLYLRILGHVVRIDCTDSKIRAIVATNFSAMVEMRKAAISPIDLHYCVVRSEQCPRFVLSHQGKTDQSAEDIDEVLFLLEKDIIVELQRNRPELLFLHAAALDWQGKACLLVGESGAGKSTTTWALQHHGFGYLSDELSPVDIDSLRVHAYPHALCLKQLPPTAYSLPGDTLHLGRTIHVPTFAMPSAVILDSRPLAALFLLQYSPDLRSPTIRAIGAAEASVYLYVSALNALAHSNSGLDPVVRLAERLPCFAVAAADLSLTCDLIRAEMKKVNDSPLP